MDYEEKYKQALERASKLRVQNPFDTVGQMVEHIFPELRKDDDERVRKGLIKAVSRIFEGNKLFDTDVTREEALAWLDKQDANKEYVFRPVAGTMIERAVEQALEQGDVVLAFNGFYTPVKYKTSDEILAEYDNWIEKQGEQPTDKVEPKFNVGDWITNGGYTWKIVEVKPLDYILQSQDGNIVDDTISYVDEQFHSFTIDDAKDGDVLAAHECFVLFKKLDGLNIKCYCTYHYMNNPSFHVDTLHNKDAFHPSTKEQRDTLMKAMANAGYEWDADKKELKRITKFKIGDKVHCGDENQPVTIIDITNDSYITDSMIGPILFSEEDDWTLINHKFKTSNWIVFNGLALYIYEIVDGYYKTVDIDNIPCSYDWVIDNIARLWTINDANDGDVLVDEYNNIGLYSGEKDDLYWHSCIYLGCDDYLRGFMGYHKHKNTKPATKEQRELLFKKMHEAGYEWRQEEKKLIKIKMKETKFKEGDFIVPDNITLSEIWEVINIDDDGYYNIQPVTNIINTEDDETYRVPAFTLEEDYHLWTIADAKDGDVLATENFIFIFKNIDDGNGVHYYCQYEINKHEDDDQFDIALPQSLMGRVGNSISHYSPATKEQRELLFSKMKEAGYEWNSEKKELKKIEYNYNVNDFLDFYS